LCSKRRANLLSRLSNRVNAFLRCPGDSLGLEVVAEGIEYENQFEPLQDLGCELG
jgi:EAL domain-containing protein (putative c-di-GMP-specific phosphodiesterase class I)